VKKGEQKKMSPLEKLAHSFNVLIGIVAVGIFAWKAIEMVIKERYSMLWLLVIGGALVGGFLFGGESFFRFLWGGVCAMVGGCS
jgi:hypothetical protein